MMLNSRQAGEIIGVSEATMARYASCGDIEAEKIGCAWAFDRETVLAFKKKKGAIVKRRNPAPIGRAASGTARKKLSGIPAIHAAARQRVVANYVARGIPEEQAGLLLDDLLNKRQFLDNQDDID